MTTKNEINTMSVSKHVGDLWEWSQQHAVDTNHVLGMMTYAVTRLETSLSAALELLSAPDDRLAYTVSEVAERIPASRQFVYEAAKSGALRATKSTPRGRWFVSRDAVIDWVSRGCPSEITLPSGRSPRSRLSYRR